MFEAARISDVAERAGVSVGTVSNFFNRPDIVAAGTRRRIEEAVEALSYVRNESARQLRMGQSRTVGLIVPDIANPFFTDVARGVEDAISAAGALLIVCNSDDDPFKEARYVTLLTEQQVQGVLLVPVGSSTAVARLGDRGVPVVLLDYKGSSKRQCSVSVNDVAGGRLAMGHLLATGHRRVAFLGVGSTAHQAVDRLKGARQALREAGRDPDELTLLHPAALNTTAGSAAATELMALPARRRPTAVACVNDLLAVGLLQELLHAGVSVPDDVAIVGYDDIAFAGAAAVPLSSVSQPRQQLGRRAAELLLDESGDDNHLHSRVVFEPELVVRESTGSGRTVRGHARGPAGRARR
jgi:LacI family transcriptional regulator